MKTVSHALGVVSHAIGLPVMVMGQFALIVVAIGLGALMHFASGYMLGLNLFLSVVTYLLLFILQASQNRDGAAMHAKLDELIKVSEARDELQRIESADEAEIERVRCERDESGEAC